MADNTDKLLALRERIESSREDAYQAALQIAGSSAGNANDPELDFALSRVETLDRRLAALPKVTHVGEPDIYTAGGPHSFLKDLASVASHGVDRPHAIDRLNRHEQHGTNRRAFRQTERRLAALAGGVVFPAEPQTRALSLGAAAGGEFAPPAYLLDEFASISRSASPVLRAVPSLPLPDRCSEVYIPRITSAGGVVVQASENTDAGQTWSTTDQIALGVSTFAGEVPLSQQLWERGGSMNLDRFIVRDFGEAAASSFEQQVIAGSGNSGQLLGLLNAPTATVDGTPGANTITYSSTTPTSQAIIAAIGETAAEVGNTRLRPPSVAIMSPERFFWLAATPDGSTNISSMRPGCGLVPTDADVGGYGPIAGLPCLLSGEVPQDLGTGENQDAVLVVRMADLLFMQSDPVFAAYVDASGGPAQLTVVVTWHAYAAFTCTRYPSAIGTLTGTGMTRNSLSW